MEKAVVRHYEEIPVKTAKPGGANVLIESSLTVGASQMQMTTGKRYWKKMLPLIVYNREHMVVETNLNYQIPVNQLANSLSQYARTQKVVDKLNGRQLVIKLDQMPHTFSFNGKSTNILLLFTVSKVYLEPTHDDLKASYLLLENGKEVKNGSVEIKDPNKNYGIQYFQSLGAAVDDYLTSYDTFYKNSGKVLMDKILAEL